MKTAKLNTKIPSELIVENSNLFSSALPKVNCNLLNLVFCGVLALVLNPKIWQIYFANNNIQTLVEVGQAISFFIFIFAIFYLITSLFVYPYLQKIIISLSLLICTPALYFSLSAGAVYDISMIQNALETDLTETIDLVTGQLIILFMVMAVLPLVFICKLKIKYDSLARQTAINILNIMIILVIGGLAVFSNYAALSSFVRNNNKMLSNSLLPIAPIYASYKNAKFLTTKHPVIKTILDPDARIQQFHQSAYDKPLAVIVMVGETAREKSFSQRDVGMEQIKDDLLGRDNLFYFSNFWSCGTNTALSVPCMFSFFEKDKYKRSMNMEYENVAELIDRVGYQVTWRNNNSGCKGVCNSLNKDPINSDNSSEFDYGGEFYDEALVVDLKERIERSNQDQVIFLHQLGSHGPAYYKRVPEVKKILSPSCEYKDFVKCNNQEILNAYNNTVLYTKQVIGQAIDTLESISTEYNTVLIYLSDHGESTGENGLYLHGIPYFMAPDEQTHIPALVWMSQGYIESRGINQECVQGKLKERFSHDYFSHTLIGLLDISTTTKNNKLDIISDCRTT